MLVAIFLVEMEQSAWTAVHACAWLRACKRACDPRRYTRVTADVSRGHVASQVSQHAFLQRYAKGTMLCSAVGLHQCAPVPRAVI